MNFVTIKAEYVWNQDNSLKSKTRFLNFKKEDNPDWKIELEDIPLLPTFLDAKETEEAILRPVFACIDPNRKNSILVLCDILDVEFMPHPQNARARMLDSFVKFYQSEPLIAFDQEYALYRGGSLIGDMNSSEYCDSSDASYQARVVGELHTNSCLNSQLMIEGFSAKYAPAFWSYRIGGVNSNPVSVCDQLLISRFLLKRAAESSGYSTLKGVDTPDVRLIVTYSDLSMRKPSPEGIAAVNTAIENLLKNNCIENKDSIRIPWETKRQGFGSVVLSGFGENDDPYIVLNTILENIG